jgi:hypothetical protein
LPPGLVGLVLVVDVPAGEIHQVVVPVVGVILQSVASVRELAVPYRFTVDEEFRLSFRPCFRAFLRRAKLGTMPSVFLPDVFHTSFLPLQQGPWQRIDVAVVTVRTCLDPRLNPEAMYIPKVSRRVKIGWSSMENSSTGPYRCLADNAAVAKYLRGP